MANFSIQNSSGIAAQQALTTTYKTIIATATTTGATGPSIALRRGKIYDMIMGCNATPPADNTIEWSLDAITAGSTFTYAGIVSSIGQQQLDSADANMATFAIVNSTAENFTVTANSGKYYDGRNQRATFRWVANPGSEIIWPATSSAGYGLRARSGAFTGTVTANLFFQEQ